LADESTIWVRWCWRCQCDLPPLGDNEMASIANVSRKSLQELVQDNLR